MVKLGVPPAHTGHEGKGRGAQCHRVPSLHGRSSACGRRGAPIVQEFDLDSLYFGFVIAASVVMLPQFVRHRFAVPPSRRTYAGCEDEYFVRPSCSPGRLAGRRTPVQGGQHAVVGLPRLFVVVNICTDPDCHVVLTAGR